ncbi:unnamed protein product [Adineta ricciae]|uniref:DDE-1 domain-containing protein n=1 Tax=Adineta ricciae TaxID=249248 RepID=A0A815WF66_ADIRI|nr:unnamed protein product [Adineta ricciae]
MGEQVKRHLFQPKNVIITCSTSGKLTTTLIEHWRDNCFLPLVGPKCLLLSDSYPGQSREELYLPENCGGKKVTRLQIPQNTTDDLQPLDCYFNRQIKNFLKACYHRVALDELDIHLHERNNIIRLVSLMHHQLSADVFTPMIKYAWFSSSLLREDPSPFVNVNQVCFPSSETHMECEENHCGESIFITCARYQSIVRIVKYLGKTPSCCLYNQLKESLKSGNGASITSLREQNGQFACTSSTKIIEKNLEFRPECIKTTSINKLQACHINQMCTVEIRTFNNQISLTATSDTSFIQIDNLEQVDEEIDNIINSCKTDKGQILFVEPIDNQYKCQGCGGTNLTENENTISCSSDCRSRLLKDKTTESLYMKVKIVTYANEEYNLKTSQSTIFAFLNKTSALKTDAKESTDLEENIYLIVGLNVQFTYDYHTGVINNFENLNQNQLQDQNHLST